MQKKLTPTTTNREYPREKRATLINPLIPKYNHPIIRGGMVPGEELRDKRVRTFPSLLKISATRKDIYLRRGEREREEDRRVEREGGRESRAHWCVIRQMRGCRSPWETSSVVPSLGRRVGILSGRVHVHASAVEEFQGRPSARVSHDSRPAADIFA